MKNVSLIIVISLCIIFLSCNITRVSISIVVPNDSGNIEKLAAKELQTYLSKIYPDYSFDITNYESQDNQLIKIGRVEQLDLPKSIIDSVPDNSEGFLITPENENTVLITSKGEEGLIFGVYQLLEKLGCRFLLDTEYVPERKGEPDLNEWDLKNEPLIKERYANPWEVYLEGCASWDLVKWKEYIRNIQRMGFNSILVHAYGNNPMFTFSFNGKTKRIGHLTSSAKGRGWGQKHVNDVRRIPGGKSVFTYRAFGSEIALVPDNERIERTQDFMGEVFNYAAKRGVKVNFALDFDIFSNIPQDLVMTLPESDRYRVTHKGIGWMGELEGTYWIPRPDKPEGYRYYKTQLEKVLNLYPRISTYTMWRRAFGSIYCTMDYEDLPESWKNEYDQFIRNNPGADTLTQNVGTFAQRKLAIAYKNIFEELGRSDIQLAVGSWRLINIETMDRFLPEDMKIIILDSEIKRSTNNLKNPKWINHLSSFLKKGRLIPIIWAHHDDGEYVGSPFREFSRFNDLLASLKTDGFAVIHWINRPLDLFFINHNRQIWKNTQNETAKTTCQFLVDGIWYNDPETAHKMSAYLLDFWYDFPTMTRANSAFIFDKPLSKYGSPDSILLKIDQRRTYLNAIKTNQFSNRQKEFINFFINYELFLKMLIENQLMYEKTQDLIKHDKLDEARNIAKKFYPEKAMEQLGAIVNESFVTNGDMGLLFSLGVRWLPHFITLKQSLELEPVRVNFATTLHEPLAQMPGKDTYFIDLNGNYWRTFGFLETGGSQIRKVKNPEVPLESDAEIFNEGLVVHKKITVDIPMLTNNSAYYTGKYKLKLYCSSNAQNQLYMSLFSEKKELPLIKAQGNQSLLQYEFELTQNGNIQLEFSAKDNSKVIIFGAVLESVK